MSCTAFHKGSLLNIKKTSEFGKEPRTKVIVNNLLFCQLAVASECPRATVENLFTHVVLNQLALFILNTVIFLHIAFSFLEENSPAAMHTWLYCSIPPQWAFLSWSHYKTLWYPISSLDFNIHPWSRRIYLLLDHPPHFFAGAIGGFDCLFEPELLTLR